MKQHELVDFASIMAVVLAGILVGYWAGHYRGEVYAKRLDAAQIKAECDRRVQVVTTGVYISQEEAAILKPIIEKYLEERKR